MSKLAVEVVTKTNKQTNKKTEHTEMAAEDSLKTNKLVNKLDPDGDPVDQKKTTDQQTHHQVDHMQKQNNHNTMTLTSIFNRLNIAPVHRENGFIKTQTSMEAHTLTLLLVERKHVTRNNIRIIP